MSRSTVNRHRSFVQSHKWSNPFQLANSLTSSVMVAVKSKCLQQTHMSHSPVNRHRSFVQSPKWSNPFQLANSLTSSVMVAVKSKCLQQTHIEGLLLRSHRCLGIDSILEDSRATRHLSVNLVQALFNGQHGLARLLNIQLSSGSVKV